MIPQAILEMLVHFRVPALAGLALGGGVTEAGVFVALVALGAYALTGALKGAGLAFWPLLHEIKRDKPDELAWIWRGVAAGWGLVLGMVLAGGFDPLLALLGVLVGSACTWIVKMGRDRIKALGAET